MRHLLTDLLCLDYGCNKFINTVFPRDVRIRFAGGSGGWTPQLFYGPLNSVIWLTPGGVETPPVGATNVIIVKCRLSSNQSKVCNALSSPRCICFCKFVVATHDRSVYFILISSNYSSVTLYFYAWNGSKCVRHDSANIMLTVHAHMG